MSEVKVNKISPRSGTDVTLGDSSDTFTVPTGAGLTVVDEVKTNKISPATGTAFALGDSGDTFTVPSGATISNLGTATGFGGANTPNFFAFLNADQTISSNTTTKVAYNDESWDTASAFDSSTNYRFTVPAGEGGKYNFTAQILLYDDAAELGGIRPMIYKNGSLVSEALWDKEFNASAYPWYNFSSNINITLNLSATDYVEVFLKGYTRDSGTFVADGHASEFYTYFQGHKIIE